MSRAVVICPGSRFAFDGEVVEVAGFEGTRVTLRDARDRWRTLGLAGFLAGAAPLEAPQGRPAPVGPLLAGLSGSEQSVVTDRAGHVREVLTGYRSGTAEAARPGEPRPDYDPARPLGGRQEAKARELGVSGRTIRRWVRAYRDSGETGLADARRVSGRRLALDPRWEQACRTVVAGQVGASTPTAGALRLIRAQLDDQYGAGAVPRPSTAADTLVYAGYSARPCVLSPSLRGLDAVDDAGAVTWAYGSEPVWDGLGLLHGAFVPYYRSPGYSETAAIELVVARYQADGVAYRALHDGQVLLINEADTAIG